jgi:AcrR family transcriptional regulator
MSEARRYVSAKREAQAAATRDAILEAFADQLSDPGRTTFSPKEAAARAGVSVRTVHHYFPNADSQILGLAEWFDAQVYPQAVPVANGPDDLARYFRDIHANALQTPLARALANYRSPMWNEVRARRRAARLDAIRRSVAEIGAPKRDTEDATAMLLSLAGADISWPMHETYGLPMNRVPDTIANTAQLIVDQLKAKRSRRRR